MKSRVRNAMNKMNRNGRRESGRSVGGPDRGPSRGPGRRGMGGPRRDPHGAPPRPRRRSTGKASLGSTLLAVVILLIFVAVLYFLNQ